MENTKTNSSEVILMIFVLFLGLLSLVWMSTIEKEVISKISNINFTDHSRISHSEQVSKIDNCFEGGGVPSAIFRTSNGRFSQFCNDGSQNNYWRIYECEGTERIVVTQFKQGIRRLANYILNHEMVPEEPPC